MKPRIAFWFRYGAAEHHQLFAALPDLLARLSAHAEVHHFGMKTLRPVPESVARRAVIHHLPWGVDMNSTRDKLVKTLLWVASVPLLSLWSRKVGATVVYMDETIPLAPLLARLFFGRQVVIIVADSFLDIYLGGNTVGRAIAAVVKRVDEVSWRRLPLIFTHAASTVDWLEAKGVKRDRMRVRYNSCDFSVFKPVPRDTARKPFGLMAEDFVLVHHGILHPNKGNDLLLRAVAALRSRIPRLKFLLIGGGPELDSLKRLATELEIGQQVIFTGRLATLEEVNLGLNCADVGLVMRTGQETDHFHVTDTLVHNMACGLAVLAVRLRGIAAVIRENENGLLFGANDLGEFVNKVCSLSEDQPGELAATRRRRMGEAALADAHRLFAVEAVVTQIAEPLEQLLREGRVDSGGTVAA